MRCGKVNNKGSATLIFMGFSLFIVGAISFALFVTKRIEHRLDVIKAAEASSRAMAINQAQSMNMIAVNNQGIAASMQLHNAFLSLSHYVGILRAASYGLDDAITEIGHSLSQRKLAIGSVIQKDVFNRFSRASSVYLDGASGLTRYNQLIRDYWPWTTPFKGVLMAKMNLPDTLVFPFSGEGNEAKKSVPFQAPLVDYKVLKTSSAYDLICLTTGNVHPGQNFYSMTDWLKFLGGPAEATSNGTGILGSAINSAIDFFSNLDVTKLAGITTYECHLGLASPIINLMRAMETEGLAKMAESFMAGFQTNLLNEARHAHPDGLPTCTPAEGKMLAELGVRATRIAADTSNVAKDKQSVSLKLKKMWEKNHTDLSVPYSTVFIHLCAMPENRQACNKRLLVREKTWMCFYKNEILDTFGNGTCQLTVMKRVRAFFGSFNRPSIQRVRIRDGIEGLFNHHCGNGDAAGFFDEWIANDQSGKGVPFVNLAKQANFYSLSDLDDSARFKFIKRGENDMEPTLGFMYINPSKENFFFDAQVFRSLLGSPIYNKDEASRVTDYCHGSGNRYEIKDESNSRYRGCMLNLYANIGPTVSEQVRQSSEFNQWKVLSEANKDVVLGQDLKKRFQWAMAKHRVNYIPVIGDPNAKKNRTTLWPAWTVTPAVAKYEDFLGFKLSSEVSAIFDLMRGNQ